MMLRTLALGAALLGATALSAHAAVVGAQSFVDIGVPTAGGGATVDIDNPAATTVTIGDLFSTPSQTGDFAGLGDQIFGAASFNTAVPASLTFGNSTSGTFTSTSFPPPASSTRVLGFKVLGAWTSGSFGGATDGPYDSSLPIVFPQNSAHTGAASDASTFSVLPAGAIPELSTWAMMGLGFAGLGFAGFRSRRTARTVV